MRKKLFMFIALLLSSSLTVMAQNGEKGDRKVYDLVDQMPTYPGGQSALFQWLSHNIKYPVAAERHGIQGRVVVQYIVMPDGILDSIKVMNSVDPSLDKEAVRVVKAMPKWNPGLKDGKPVMVRYILPVSFSLSNEKQKPNEKPNVSRPSFPDGKDALSKFIADSIKYPAVAKKKGIQGRVYIGFYVEADGSLTEIDVLAPLDPEIDAEAMRIVKSMPRWIPAKDKEGKAVKAHYTLPVTFRLQ